MEVKKLFPHGYCGGVKLALKQCIEAIKNPLTKRPIYLLGMPIHNKHVKDALINLGVIILDGDLRINLLNQINSGTVILSAHGVAKMVIEKALNKGLDVIDTTCSSVKMIQERLRQTNREILYIGKNNHPESEAVITEFSNAYLIENINDLMTLNKNKPYYMTTQTTMSIYDVKEITDYIHKHFTDVVVESMVCKTTTIRQEALFNQEADLIVIIGDKASSNTQKLYEVAVKHTKHQMVIKIENVNDLAKINLSNYQTALIASGASTPMAIIEEVYQYLLLYPNKKAISELTLDDYLIL